jgi:Tfp pilus assembly protein PilF
MDHQSDARWEQIKEIFAKLHRVDPAERGAVLDDVCRGDPELRAQVEQLYDNYDAALAFFVKFPDLLGLAADGRTLTRTLSEGEILAERFRIIGLLGKGGMGEVYEAEDLVLGDEHVALKTLPASLATDESAIERLNLELRLARRITHPNVCRVHEVFQHRSAAGARVAFFTMELLKGDTLTNRLRTGPLTTASAFAVVAQMAAAMDAAHLANVVHGDFKPGNIMLVASETGGERVVVTDFGLARWRPAGSALLSTVGGSRQWGTPAYMAPEQLFGGNVTRATDIYAFGVVLYEMVTGNHPFTADEPMMLALRKVRHAPRAPRQFVNDLDPCWEAVILRCLDANPEKRFESAIEIVNELRSRPEKMQWRLPVAAALACAGLLAIPPARQWVAETLLQIPTTLISNVGSEQTVALLPFTQQNPSPEGDAFSLGLTAAVTDRLGILSQDQPRLYVAPAVQVIDTGVDTPALVQHTLGANLIITGRLSALSNGTRLTIELNEISRESNPVSESRTVELRPGGAELLEDEVVTLITSMLQMSPPPEKRLGAGGSPSHREAEESYLRGRGYLLQGSGALTSAITAFQQAIQKNEKYAAAYAGLSEAYLGHYDATRDVESLKAAGIRIDEAIALDPLDARSRVIRGRVYLTTGQHQRATLEFQNALGLDPKSPTARNQLAATYEAQGATEMAEQEYRKSIALHPSYWSGYEDLGNFLYRQGRYAEAEQNYVMGAGYAPANRRAIVNLAAVYEVQGRYLAAENELIRGLKLSPNALLYNNLGWIRILEGKFDDAADALEEAVKQPRADSIVWSGLARAHRWAGKSPADERAAYKTALERTDEELRVNPLNPEIRANRAYLLAETQQDRQALAEMTEVLASEHARGRVTVLFRSALVHELVGDRSGALEALELAVRGGYPIHRIAHDPDLRELRNDPGYQRVLDVAARGAN